MKTFEIYFSDLNEDAQKRLLEAVGAESAADMNWDMDICPIAMYDFETEEETFEKWEEIYNVLDNMNIYYDTNYCDLETEALIEFWTNTARQDIPMEFDYDGSPEDFVKQFTERAERYDVDEEVELFVNMRGKKGVPDTVRELLNDCQEAKDTLMEIAERLQGAIKG